MRIYKNCTLLIWKGIAFSFLCLLVADLYGEPQKSTPLKPDCTSPNIHCGRGVLSQFDNTGTLWATFVEDGTVYITHSKDNATTFSDPIAVNPIAEEIYDHGENRPKIAFGPGNEIYISWTQKTKGMYTGNIRFAFSLDQGKTFSKAKTINDDGLLTSHRFDSLTVDKFGHIYLAWIDKRDKIYAKQRNESYKGAAIYYTVSKDNGKTFATNQLVAPHSCECCRVASTPIPTGGAAILWRHIFDNEFRDHGLAVVNKEGLVQPYTRASQDNWKLNACPHHGPAITSDNQFLFFTWFTGAKDNGIFFRRYNIAKQRYLPPHQIAHNNAAQHPDILYHKSGIIYLVWKELHNNTQIKLSTSENLGRSWSPPQTIAETEGFSDYAFAVSTGEQAYLSWQTDNEGYQLIPL